MKKRLTLGVDGPSAFELPPGDPPREGARSWAQRWAGILKDRPGPPPGEDARYDYLMRRHGR